jgi:Protein of unknown function (DUF993)
MTTLNLPAAGGTQEALTLTSGALAASDDSRWNRIAYAAVHVVSNPLADIDPWLDVDIDWDRTLAFREYLWDLGLGVAEAMDTAQRGNGLDWPTSLELIRRTAEAASARDGARLVCGAGTDHLAPSSGVTIDAVVAAYEEQCGAVEAAGARIALMASRALAACATGPADYINVYDRILSQTAEPVIVHWLGEMFDPALAGYWGTSNRAEAMDTCVEVLRRNAAKVEGIKVSLLSAELEVALRDRLPEGVRMYTGDDFNFPELIGGDGNRHSDALLGVFDPIAAIAASALTALGDGDKGAYDEILAPTVPLARHIFRSPTQFYKTGVVFLAYLNGHQDHFTMVGGQESARSVLHLADIIRLANAAQLFDDPERVAARARPVFMARGVEI